VVLFRILDASDITFGYRHFWAQNTNLCITELSTALEEP